MTAHVTQRTNAFWRDIREQRARDTLAEQSRRDARKSTAPSDDPDILRYRAERAKRKATQFDAVDSCRSAYLATLEPKKGGRPRGINVRQSA